MQAMRNGKWWKALRFSTLLGVADHIKATHDDDQERSSRGCIHFF